MQRRQVGATGIELSVVGLGGTWLGHELDDAVGVKRAATVLQSSLECGINWVDTSENYFDTGNEAVIGAALRSLPDNFLVCSKAAPSASHSGGGSGFRPEQIRRACEASLRRLGREQLDLYLLHWPDESGVPLSDTWGAMAGLVDDGWVRAIGMSNYNQHDIARCHQERQVDLIQTGLSIVDYLDDRDLIAWCGREGIAVAIYEPLANGLLTDTPFEQVRARWAESPWQSMTAYPNLLCAENAHPARQVTAGLRRIADDVGATVAAVALAWVLGQPGVTSAIAGSSDPERTKANAQAADLVLPDTAVSAIERDLIPLTAQFAGRR